MDLTSKVAIITGGAQGLGKAEALALATAGANIVLVDKNATKCQQAAKEVQEIGKQVLPLYADVSIVSDVQKMVDKTVEEFGAIDILVNNAAIVMRKETVELTLEEWDAVINVNLRGVFLCSQAVARQMIKQGRGGKIINLTSIGAFLGEPLRSVYCASKGGLTQLTKVMAVELAPYGINVNAIAPGLFLVGMSDDTSRKDPEFYEHLMQRIPLKRAGSPEDIAGVTVLLASSASDFITGETIVVDGGLSVH